MTDEVDSEYEFEEPTRRQRIITALGDWSRRSERNAALLERRYLSALRYLLLGIATVAIVGAVVLFLWGAIRQLGSTTVEPSAVTIEAGDLSPLTPAEARNENEPVEVKREFALDQKVRTRTLALYRDRFAPFERSEEVVQDEKIIAEIWPEDRWDSLSGISGIELTTAEDQKVETTAQMAEFALGLIGEAALTEGFQRSLVAYRDAKKSEVCRSVTRERQRTVNGWDSYSTSCTGWYYSPIGCPTTRTVSEPYTARVCEMQYPAELDNPREAFGNALDRFVTTAQIERESNFYTAQSQTAERKQRKLAGQADMGNALRWLAAFVAIMLVYLFVALERHHRLLRKLLPPDTQEHVEQS